MARRDYASKPKQRKAATRQEPPKRSAASRPVAKKSSSLPVIIISFVALVALVGLITFLVQNAPEVGRPAPESAVTPKPIEPKQPTPAQTVTAPQGSAQPRAPGESLPLDNVELDQEERFGFYRILQENEVQTPEESAYTSTPKTAALDGTYILQTGSFRNQSDAEAMRARLTLSNLPNVNTNRSEGSNGVWYRVTTGPFSTYAELRDATTRLEKLNIHPIKRKIN